MNKTIKESGGVRKFLDLEGLGQYNAKVNVLIDEKSKQTLQKANDFAVSLGDNYEAVGTSATAKVEAVETAKGYTDSEISKTNTAIDNVKKTADKAALDVTEVQSSVDKLKTDFETLDTRVGSIPAESGAATVVAYIDKKTEGIASDAKLKELEGRVATAEGDIDGVEVKVTTLVGADADKSVRTIANEELAAQLIPEGAQESMDTLQELAAWIQQHPEDASAMNASIKTLEGKAHEHANKDVLDGVTSDKVAAWDGKADADHVHAVATAASDGFMSKVDKAKLDGLDGAGKIWGFDMMSTPVGLTFKWTSSGGNPFAGHYVGDISNTNAIEQLPIEEMKVGDYINLVGCTFIDMQGVTKNHSQVIHRIEEIVDDKNIAISTSPVSELYLEAGTDGFNTGLITVADKEDLQCPEGAYVRAKSHADRDGVNGFYVPYAGLRNGQAGVVNINTDNSYFNVGGISDNYELSIDAYAVVKDVLPRLIDENTLVYDTKNIRLQVNVDAIIQPIATEEIDALFA